MNELATPEGVASSKGLGLVERLRQQFPDVAYHRDQLHRDAADEIERLRAALSAVREYPDFDDGGPLPEMMDQVLRGERAPMLEKLAEWQQLYGPEA